MQSTRHASIMRRTMPWSGLLSYEYFLLLTKIIHLFKLQSDPAPSSQKMDLRVTISPLSVSLHGVHWETPFLCFLQINDRAEADGGPRSYGKVSVDGNYTQEQPLIPQLLANPCVSLPHPSPDKSVLPKEGCPIWHPFSQKVEGKAKGHDLDTERLGETQGIKGFIPQVMQTRQLFHKQDHCPLM